MSLPRPARLLGPFLPLAGAGLALLMAGPAALAQSAGRAPTPQAECSAANRQAMADLLKQLDAARKRHLLNPMQVTRLQTFEAQLATLRGTANRPARTVADCEQTAAAIQTEGEKLERLAGDGAATATAAAAPVAGAGEMSVASVLSAAPAPAPAADTRRAAVPVPAPAAVPAPAPAPVPVAPPPPPPPPAAPTPDPAICWAGVVKSFNQVLQGLGEIQRDRTGVQASDADLLALANRLQALRGGITGAMQAAPAASNASCEQLGRTVAGERELMQRIAPGRLPAG